MPLNLNTFVHNVRNLAKIKGLPVTTALKEAGLSQNLLNHIETRGSSPSVEKVQQLAQYFGVTTSQLLGEVSVGSKMDSVSLDDMDLIHAYHAADERTREIVQLTLKPFGQCVSKEKAM